MDLSVIVFEDFRKLQNEIRVHVESKIFRFAKVRLENIERLSINEITRNLLTSYIGTFKDFTYNEDASEKEKYLQWKRFSRSFDIHEDTFTLFLMNYGIDPKEYFRNQYQD